MGIPKYSEFCTLRLLLFQSVNKIPFEILNVFRYKKRQTLACSLVVPSSGMHKALVSIPSTHSPRSQPIQIPTQCPLCLWVKLLMRFQCLSIILIIIFCCHGCSALSRLLKLQIQSKISLSSHILITH